MENSQLINVLKTLDKTEFREFGKFVRSPYFNNRSEVIRFYDAIKKFYPQFKSKDFIGEKIFIKVYPAKKYNDVMMRKLVSLTKNLVMDFYAISSFKENALDYNVKLMYKLYDKQLPAMFEKKAKNTEELFRKAKHTFDYYESKFNYTSILFGHRQKKNEKGMIYKLQDELDDFTEFFISIMLFLYIRLSTWSRIYDVKYDLKFYDEVLEFISAHNFEDVTLVSLYYNMLMLMNTGAEKYFFELQKDWNKFEAQLSDLEQHNIYVALGEYCIKRIRKGDVVFRKQQFDITKTFLKKNLLPKETGYMEPYFFTSIVRNASNLKEFKWTDDFIKSYKNKLDPELVEEITHYSLAIVEFDKGNYEKSLKHLSTINPESLNMKLNVKNLTILNYYELSYDEELISSIDAYKHFLNRDKDAGKRLKQRDTNFIKFVSALVKIKHNEKNESALKLKKEIEKSPYFDTKGWLIKKADELIK